MTRLEIFQAFDKHLMRKPRTRGLPDSPAWIHLSKPPPLPPSPSLPSSGLPLGSCSDTHLFSLSSSTPIIQSLCKSFQIYPQPDYFTHFPSHPSQANTIAHGCLQLIPYFCSYLESVLFTAARGTILKHQAARVSPVCKTFPPFLLHSEKGQSAPRDLRSSTCSRSPLCPHLQPDAPTPLGSRHTGNLALTGTHTKRAITPGPLNVPLPYLDLSFLPNLQGSLPLNPGPSLFLVCLLYLFHTVVLCVYFFSSFMTWMLPRAGNFVHWCTPVPRTVSGTLW